MGRMILIPGADYSGANFGQVTPSDNLPIEAITINGPGAAYGNATYTGRVWPVFTNQRRITWSIASGDTYASINASTGQLSVVSGTSEQPVTIRCTSIDNPNIYTEKTIICDSGTIVYYDYLTSDQTGYVLIDRFPSLIDATVTAIYKTGDAANCYMLSNTSDSLGTARSYALYLQSNGTTSRVAPGTKGTSNITTSNAKSIRYRAVLTLSSSTSLADASFVAYNDATDAQIVSYGSFSCYLNSYFCVFGYCRASSVYDEASVSNIGNGRFYGMVVEKNNETIADYRPCTIDGTPCLLDYVSGLTYYSATGSGLSVGNE